MELFYFPLSQIIGEQAWPAQAAEGDGQGVLDHIYISSLETDWDEDGMVIRGHFLSLEEIGFKIPGLSWLTLALSPAPEGTDFPIQITLTPFKIQIKELPIVFKVDREILQPMKTVNEPDPTKETTD